MITPVGSPTVLNDPVLVAFGVGWVGAVADDGNSVVHVCSVRVRAIALSIGDDARTIATKTAKVRVDCATNWTFSD